MLLDPCVRVVQTAEKELTACVLSLSTVASTSQICFPSENQVVCIVKNHEVECGLLSSSNLHN